MKRSTAYAGCRLLPHVALLFSLLALAGCTAVLNPLSGIPAHRLPPQFLAQPKNNMVPIDFTRLQQDPPEQYLIDTGDVLGIFIENEFGEAAMGIPQQSIPPAGSDLPPAVGAAVPVREDGTILLTVPEPIEVRGLNLRQIENILRHRYTIREQRLPPDIKIMVSLMRKRNYTITLIRRDTAGPAGTAAGRGGLQRGQVVLPAYRNDVLNALTASGGLPGIDAKNEVIILRGRNVDARARETFIKNFYANPPADPCLCFPPLPDDPTWVRIPLRLPPGQVPSFQEEDIVLNEGDIILIEGRENDVYYTGGLLGGGVHPLPRDHDIDVLQAMGGMGGAISGGMGGGQQGGGGGGFGGNGGMQQFGGVSPSLLYILRKTPCDGQIVITVDLNRAVKDPAARPLVQAGDTLILRFKPQEEVLNFALGTFLLRSIYGGRGF
ncbi:MAG: polysaccharide biosynthesis/export family protein [Planctomycetota bacterium]|nr:polysaccharide biosynthesis/export family protein [Planctomycetota bacterium]